MNDKTTNKNEKSAILLIHCPDKKGIVVSVTEFIYKNKGNIVYLDQHVDAQEKVFFMRIEWDLSGFMIPTEKISEFFDVLVSQEESDFAIPFLDEDIPFCLDPFLLWRSPSMQDTSLHAMLVNSFNYLGFLVNKGT